MAGVGDVPNTMKFAKEVVVMCSPFNRSGELYKEESSNSLN